MAGARPRRERHGALGQPARHDRGARRLPLLGRHEVRLLRRHRDRPRARADGSHGHDQAGRPGPGGHGLPFARRVLPRPRAGHPSGLGLAHGRLRRVQLRLQEGREGRRDRRPRRQDHPPRQRRLAGDRRPDAGAGRGRPEERHLRRGRQPLGPGADAGPGRRRALLGGLRAQWTGQGLDFDYILPIEFSKFPANSFVIRRADFEDETKDELYEAYLRAWAMGLEFGYQNPRATTHLVLEQFPALASTLTPRSRPDR